jgi:hypothetical protein
MRTTVALVLAAIAAASCSHRDETGKVASEVRQTHFPGEITAGGGTSGEVLARNQQATQGAAKGGTPGTGGGMEGNTGGTAPGGKAAQSDTGQTAQSAAGQRGAEGKGKTGAQQ